MPSSGSVSPAPRGRSPSVESFDSNHFTPVKKSVAFARGSFSGDRGRNNTSNNGFEEARTGPREIEPLLSAPRGQSIDAPRKGRELSVDTDQHWDDSEESRSTLYLFVLALPLGGLQIAWSVELASVSPFLLSLGLSKSFLALVWIAGPLSGTLVQPYIGIKSDNCRISWGRRKPFMIGGAISTMICLLAIAWTREIVGGTSSLFGLDAGSKGTQIACQAWAILLVYVLDFAINVIQAAIRAFIVDCAPTHQQEDANAWASRITGVGNIIGYLSGYVYLPNIVPFLGDTQFKALCAIACVLMALTLTISCFCISERDPRLLGEPNKQGAGVVAFFQSLFRSMRNLPLQIRKICMVQVFAWVAWFPFLFYITTYVGEIYAEPYFEANPHMTEEEINAIWEKGTRVGTFALFTFAIITFISSVILPFIIAPSYHDPKKPLATPLTPTTPTYGAEGGYFAYKPPSKKRRRNKFFRFFTRKRFQISSLTLRRAWLLSHIVLAITTWCTFFVRNVTGATILVGSIGVPWALTNWAPFALIAAEISKRDAIRRGLRAPPATRDGELLASGEDDSSADQAGVVLGIHNVAIAAPQVIATLGSSIIFRALQKPRGTPGDHSVAWVLRIGGIFALGAAFMTKFVGEGAQDEEEADEN